MHCRKLTVLFTILLFSSIAASGQSLGDVARQERQKQPPNASATPRKVITNDEIPSRIPDAPAPTSKPSTVKRRSDDDPEQDSPDSAKNAQQVKAAIAAEKATIKAVQKQVDELRASVHYVESKAYSNGVQYNQEQLRKQQEADRMQAQLEEEKKRLAEMQEAARKAGFGGSVYDP